MRSLTHGALALGSLLASAAAFAADFSGTWNISSKVGDNTVSIQCTLVQRDNALTGTCKPAQFDPSSTTGTVSGTKATWGYDVVFNGTRTTSSTRRRSAPTGRCRARCISAQCRRRSPP